MTARTNMAGGAAAKPTAATTATAEMVATAATEPGWGGFRTASTLRITDSFLSERAESLRTHKFVGERKEDREAPYITVNG